MSAGPLSRRMQVQYRTRAADGAGGWTEGWAVFGDRWVEYTPLSRRERIQAMALNLDVVGTARLRYDPELPRPLRLVDGPLLLEQVGGQANVDDRREWVEFDVRETQPDTVTT